MCPFLGIILKILKNSFQLLALSSIVLALAASAPFAAEQAER
jgi:hypothetical protein